MRCSGCSRRVLATEKNTMLDEPNMLVLHMKRAVENGKIHKRVKYDATLDLAQYMDPAASPALTVEGGAPAGPARYTLTAVVVHHGEAMNSGHYATYLRRAGESTWWVQLNAGCS